MATCPSCAGEIGPSGRCARCQTVGAPESAGATRVPSELRTETVVRVWSGRSAGGPQSLEPGRLLDYRYPGEIRSLVVALGVVMVMLVAAVIVNPVVAVGVIVLWATLVVSTWLRISHHIASAAEITPDQFSHLHLMIEEVRQQFDMPYTRVFVVQSPILNAFAFGFKEPYLVVLHSALVDALDPIELKSVVGHEMGHIKFGHTRLSVLLGGLDIERDGMPFPLSLLAAVRRFIFLWWQRCQELTADRAGVLASGRPSKTVSALVKLNVGPTMFQHVNIDTLAQQAADLRVGWWRVWGFLSQISATHPFMVNRIQAIVDFVGGPRTDSDLAAVEPPEMLGSPRTESPSTPAGIVDEVPAPAPAPSAPAPAPGVAPRAASQPAPPPAVTASPVRTPKPVAPRDPAQPIPALLKVREGSNANQVFWLDGSQVILGRASDSEIPISDSRMSRRHCQVYWADGDYVLEDLGSSNGTFVNGEPIMVTRLHDGDRIALGHTVLEFALATPGDQS
jgi:Zn-dependent protease with chaperone function